MAMLRFLKRIYFRVSIFLGSRLTIVYALFYYLYARRLVRIDKEGRVGMERATSLIIRACNLRCQYCTAHSPIRQGLVSADKLLSSYVKWRKKIKPKLFMLTGGEPFLHPELDRIIRESALIWNDSKLYLFTNGLLLDRAKPEVLHAIKETGYRIIISEHTSEPEHRVKLDAGYKRLKEAMIPFVVTPSSAVWTAIHKYDEHGNPIPYRNSPKKAWNHCVFRHCSNIQDNRLFRCGHLSYVSESIEEGVLDREAWKAALMYQPLTLDSTPEEIIAHLRSSATPACAICPDKREVLFSHQLPVRKSANTI